MTVPHNFAAQSGVAAVDHPLGDQCVQVCLRRPRSPLHHIGPAGSMGSSMSICWVAPRLLQVGSVAEGASDGWVPSQQPCSCLTATMPSTARALLGAQSAQGCHLAVAKSASCHVTHHIKRYFAGVVGPTQAFGSGVRGTASTAAAAVPAAAPAAVPGLAVACCRERAYARSIAEATTNRSTRPRIPRMQAILSAAPLDDCFDAQRVYAAALHENGRFQM